MIDQKLLIQSWTNQYSERTRVQYLNMFGQFSVWLEDELGITDLSEVRRIHVSGFLSHCTHELGNKPSSVAHKLVVIRSFFKYVVDEEYLDKDPTAKVRRPTFSDESSRVGISPEGIRRALEVASKDPMDNALIHLLALNGLRIQEACDVRIENLSETRGHHTLKIVGKGKKTATVVLSERTWQAVQRAAGSRREGYILLNHWDKQHTPHSARRAVRRIAHYAGLDPRVTPHSFRHAFVTNALDAGAPLRDVQVGARHANPGTTMRYDRNREALDRHPTYILESAYSTSQE